MRELNYNEIGRHLVKSPMATPGGPVLYDTAMMFSIMGFAPKKPLQLLPELAICLPVLGMMAQVLGRDGQCMDERVRGKGRHAHCAAEARFKAGLLEFFPHAEFATYDGFKHLLENNEEVEVHGNPDMHHTNALFRNWGNDTFDLGPHKVHQLCSNGLYAPLVQSIPVRKISQFALAAENNLGGSDRDALRNAFGRFNMDFVEAVAFGAHNDLSQSEVFHVVDINMPNAKNDFEFALMQTTMDRLGQIIRRNGRQVEYHSVSVGQASLF